MIYYIDKIDLYGEQLFDELKKYCSYERLEYALKYKFLKDRLQSVLVYALLRVAVYKEYGFRDILRFNKEKGGKPFLLDYPNIHFNLSHCKKGVACAVSSGNVGIDIQDFCDFDYKIINMFMSESEKIKFQNNNKKTEFMRIWSLKESFGKYTGEGICYDMTQTEIKENLFINGHISQSFLFEDFVISVTSEDIMPVHKITINELKDILQNL